MTRQTRPRRCRRGEGIRGVDLFCGAGGMTDGAIAAGVEVIVGANHWDVACRTYATNNPAVDVRCVDISRSDPAAFPGMDILLAGPECKTHSNAGPKRRTPDMFDPQGDPAVERSRVTMLDVIAYTDEHRPELVFVENVVEVARWELFNWWIEAFHNLGYQHRIVSLNSMVTWPTPQSRDRVYMCFWRQGNPKPDLEIRPACWCPHCETQVEGVQTFKREGTTLGKYRQQYLYRCHRCHQVAWPIVHPALDAIDLGIPCPKIGDRKKPLAAATRRRIELGLEWLDGSAVVQIAGNTFERPGYVRAWGLDDPIPTQTTTAQYALALDPFVVKNYGNEGEAKYRAHPITDPLGSVTTADSHALVVPLHHLSDDSVRSRSVLEPWPSQTGEQEQALVVPLRTNGRARLAAGEPTATVTTGGGGGQTVLVVPMRRNGKMLRADQVPWATVTAGGLHHGVVVVKNYGDGTDPSMYLQPDGSPLGTVTAVDSQSLLELPFLTDYHGKGGSAAVTDPLRTVDTHDRHALVEASWSVDDCGLRMLTPREIGRACAFREEYVVLGSQRDQVRQYGHAVSPPASTELVGRMIATLVA